MSRLRFRLRTWGFLLYVWLYSVYLFGVLTPYTIRGTIPWTFIGKSYLIAANSSPGYMITSTSQIPTIYNVLPTSMPFIERELIIAEYALLNNPAIPLIMLGILIAFGMYLVASGLVRVRFARKPSRSN